MQQQNFPLLKGDSFAFEFMLAQRVDGAARPVDLAGSTLTFEAWWDGGQIEKSTDADNGISIVDAPAGHVRVALSKAEVETMPAGDIRYRIGRPTADEARTMLLGFLKVKDFS